MQGLAGDRLIMQRLSKVLKLPVNTVGISCEIDLVNQHTIVGIRSYGSTECAMLCARLGMCGQQQ